MIFDNSQAMCRDQLQFFFAPENEREAQRLQREAAAKALCNRCPIQEQCLEYALMTFEKNGIWGGLNEEERKSVIRQRRRQRISV